MKDKTWVCSDSDCRQYYQQVDKYSWEYVEIRNYDGEVFHVCASLIDLREFSYREIESYCRSYYDSLEQIVETYGHEEGLHIMAECIFEQTYLLDMDHKKIFTNMPDAEKYLKEYIGE